MIRFINQFLGGHDRPSTDFSQFFTEAPAREQKKVVKRAVEQANRDQLDKVRQAKSGR